MRKNQARLMKILLLLLTTLPLLASEFTLSPHTTQAVVGIASGWNSSHVTLQYYEKDPQGAWHFVARPWKGRLGQNGLAWGRGIHPLSSGTQLKKEGDRRSPAGVFLIGGAWAYDPKTKHHPNLPFSRITSRDLWIEDSNSKSYNQHVRLNREPTSTWEKKAQMRQGDYAHSIKLFIKHNAPNPVPEGGSSIFFHIWRGGGSKATFGCTTMQESQLKSLIQWLDPKRNPVYILLPKEEYKAKRLQWRLP